MNDIQVPFAFAILFGLASTAMWLVIGWRAMRAHERIADAVETWDR